MWKSHLIAISKGRGKGVKTCFGFSSISTARHFHRRPRRSNVLAPLSAGMRSRRFYPRATAKNPSFARYLQLAKTLIRSHCQRLPNQTSPKTHQATSASTRTKQNARTNHDTSSTPLTSILECTPGKRPRCQKYAKRGRTYRPTYRSPAAPRRTKDNEFSAPLSPCTGLARFR